MQLHQQFNMTPFRTGIGFCQDGEGRDLVVGLLKATFHFAANGPIAAAARDVSVPIFKKDVFHGEPASSSLRYSTDLVPSKPGVDIAVVGHAYGRESKSVEAGFAVAACEKVLRVWGPRCWVGGRDNTIAGPVAFSKIPLLYEHAYGGSDKDGAGNQLIHDQNPVGVGFAMVARDKAPLPNFEYRAEAIRSIKDRPRPAGLGFIPTGWKQRAQFAGTFDAAWEKSRRPLFPSDFDQRFHNAVPQDQVLPGGLRGGEKVGLRNLDPRAVNVVFGIPVLHFVAIFRVKDRIEELPMKADTVLIEPDEERFAITFRSVCALGDDFRFLQSVTFKEIDR
jgi:hypothetical protein